ncbi:MAG TPA: VanZ family protein [Terriglobia bacterium]|nr:VanZ family protein [Terriglobia bacterium]
MSTSVNSTPQNPAGSDFFERWLPLVIWLTVIHMFSSDSFSANRTSSFFEPILRFIWPGLSEDAFAFWHGVFRKSGHVIEYFALGALAFRASRNHRPGVWRALTTLAFVFAIALSDEFHQSMVPSRTASIFDVGYDCSGAVLALSVMTRRKYSGWV